MKPALLALQLLGTSLLALATASATAACYTVYDASGRVVHRADAPPATVAQAGRLPDGGRVVLNGDQCGHDVTLAEQVAPARQPASAPLLTDVQVAAAVQAPYAVVGQGIAVVAPADAERVWKNTPIVDSATSESPSAADRARLTETVITEWADGRTEVEHRPLARHRDGRTAR